MVRRSDDEQLLEMAQHLEISLRLRLLQLVDADSRARRVVELEQQAQRAEDLVAEIRRQMKWLERDRDKVLEDAAAAIDAEHASEEARLGTREVPGLIGNWLGGFTAAAETVRNLKGTP
jgi:hypothetical protein